MDDRDYLALDQLEARRYVLAEKRLQQRAKLISAYCKKHGISPVEFVGEYPNENKKESGRPTSSGAGLKTLGLVLICVGILAIVGAFLFSVGVPVQTPDLTTGISLSSEVANTDLVAKRAMIGEAGGFILVAGSIFVAAGMILEVLPVSRHEEATG